MNPNWYTSFNEALAYTIEHPDDAKIIAEPPDISLIQPKISAVIKGQQEQVLTEFKLVIPEWDAYIILPFNVTYVCTNEAVWSADVPLAFPQYAIEFAEPGFEKDKTVMVFNRDNQEIGFLDIDRELRLLFIRAVNILIGISYGK